MEFSKKEEMKENENQQPRNRNRIFVDRSHRDLVYVELTNSLENEDVSPFESMKNLFMLAVFVGYHEKKKLPLKSGNRVDIFRWDQFGEDDVFLLRALALAETGEIEVLINQDMILSIAEQYAHSGIIEIQEKMEGLRENRIRHLVRLLGARIPMDSTQDLIKTLNV